MEGEGGERESYLLLTALHYFHYYYHYWTLSITLVQQEGEFEHKVCLSFVGFDFIKILNCEK